MYKGQSGMWSWLFHRVTGLALLLFLLIHIVDISLLSFGPPIYNAGIAFFDSIIARLLSLALIAAAIYHALNGVRIILIDFWKKGVHYQKVMFAAVMIVTILAFIPFAIIVLLPKLGGVALWFIEPVMKLAGAGH